MGKLGYRHTEATKKHLSKLARERCADPNYRLKLSEAARNSYAHGRMNPRKGIIVTDETKKKMSDAAKGRPSAFRGKTHSEETKQKLSMITKTLWQDPEYAKKTLENNRGRQYSEEAKKRFSIRLRGSGNPNWRGGKLGYNRIRLSTKRWMLISRRVMSADNYTCQRCGIQRAKLRVALQVHHIIPHALGGPDEDWNLITYCRSCHSIVEHQEGAIKISMERTE